MFSPCIGSIEVKCCPCGKKTCDAKFSFIFLFSYQTSKLPVYYVISLFPVRDLINSTCQINMCDRNAD